MDGGDAYTHAEGTAKVIEDDPGAGIALVIHCGGTWSRGLGFISRGGRVFVRPVDDGRWRIWRWSLSRR